jgi:hypothetical protein
MTKLMRKNRKILMAIFGALLMVMFLLSGPNIFQPDPMKQVVATAYNREVRRAELNQADAEYAALSEFAPAVVEGLQIEHGAHWMLLSNEAMRAGLVGDQQDGRNLIPQIAEISLQMFAQSIPPDQYQTMRDQLAARLENEARPLAAAKSRMSLEAFDRTLAKLQGVVRLRGQYMNALRISDRRGVTRIKDMFDGIVVDGTVIPAERLLAEVPEPTEEEIQAQFERYKNVQPGTGEYGFGYIQPPRIKFEYMELDREALKHAVKLDPVAVSKFYLQNRSKYTGDEVTETPRVREDLLNARVDSLLADAERMYTSRLKPELRNLPQDGAYRRLPADWNQTGIRMATLAEAISEGFKAAGYDFSPTVTVRAEGWTKVQDLGREPGIGWAQFRIGTLQGDLRRLVENLRELNPRATIGFQAGIPFDTFLVEPGTQDRFYINVLEWRPESPAESIEEVRADVIRDLKLKAAFDRLVAMSDSLRSRAVTEGLDAIAAAYPAPAPLGAADPTPRPLPVFRYANMTRQFAPGELNHEVVRDAAMTRAGELGVKLVATPENLADRTIVVPVPGKLSLAIVQVLGHRPVTLETARSFGRGTYNYFLQQELRENTEIDPFSFDALQKRANYKAAKEGEAAPKNAG